MKQDKLKVGVIGATGMVGQRFLTLLEHHPYFEVTVLAASASSAGKTYAEAVDGRWKMAEPLPEVYKSMRVYDADADFNMITKAVDFVFCAVNMKKDEIKALEERYAKAETPVVSNNSANRWTDDVPMVIPEINDAHLAVIEAQRRRLGTRHGFIAVKPNCSIQSYVGMLTPLLKYGITEVIATTYQAISGAGKTFREWPEMIDNVIPYIGGEEEKSEQEPLKIWGKVVGGRSIKADAPVCAAPSPTGIRQPSSSSSKTSRPRSRSLPTGAPSPASRNPSDCRARPSTSSPILKRTTARRQSSTATCTAAWVSRQADCARMSSLTTSLSDFRTTPCAVPQAARCSSPSCSTVKAISSRNKDIRQKAASSEAAFCPNILIISQECAPCQFAFSIVPTHEIHLLCR